MEESGFAILMLLFGGALLLYAGILYVSGDSGMIMREYASKKKGKKYARQVAKIIATVAMAPIICGALVLRGQRSYGIYFLIAGAVVLLTLGVQNFARDDHDLDKGKKEESETEGSDSPYGKN